MSTSNSNNSNNSNNENTNGRPVRGGGRGRGRGGRGRGRGRGGRGRGRHHKDSKDNTDVVNTSNTNTTTNNNTPPKRGGGRSKPNHRRGRGGRGRGARGSRSPPAAQTATPLQEETTVIANGTSTTALLNHHVETTTSTNSASLNTTSNAFLNLPSPQQALEAGSSAAHLNSSNRRGVPMVLSRTLHPPPKPTTDNSTNHQDEDHDHDAHMQLLSERLAEAALEEEVTTTASSTAMDASHEAVTNNNADQLPDSSDDIQNETTATENDNTNTNNNTDPTNKSDKKKKPKRKKKPKKKQIEEETPQADVSTSEAFTALPAQEVSITATTLVKLPNATAADDSANAAGGLHDQNNGKIAPGKKGKSKRKKKGLLSKDNASNQMAARRFNNQVRQCVEKSDLEAIRELLYDRRNHNFALDHFVLDICMKAFVVAALFEDALYCLRNCTLPGTLSTMETERILTCLPQNLRNSSAFTAADMINQLCIATEFDSQTSRTYFLRIARGVALEFLEEATKAREHICSWHCDRLVRSALCVVNAKLKRGKKPTELLVMPGDQLGVFVPDTMENRGIQAGDAVSILPYAGPYPMSPESLDRNMIEATVTNINPMVLRLQDKANADLYSVLTEEVEGNLYRIDKLANRMGFNRQLAAAVAMCSPLGDNNGKDKTNNNATPVPRDPRRPCPQLIKAITAMDENINLVMRKSNSGSGLQQRGPGEMTSTAALCAQIIPWNAQEETPDTDQDAVRASARLALDKYGALEGLNASQQLAVEGATTNRLTLVQGPPGTGKTAVAIRILQHWARLAKANVQKGENPSPILATSDSNIAVDNLVEGCAAVGLKVVRLGRPEAIRPELLRYCIDRPPQRDGNGNYSSGGNTNFKERMKQLKSAQVICCTCIGSGADILDSLGPLERILVDEATQATEPAIIVPLMRGCRQLVLVGDHCQLPPTVLSTKAQEEGHGVPLFSRMVACGVPPYMLDTQYRMHPCIAMFPSDLFYGGLLKNGVSAPERRPLAGFPWPREEFPVAFIPVQGIERDDGNSKQNQEEAEAAVQAVSYLLEGGQCSVSDIAVVTPYAAQARLIRRMVRGLQHRTGPPFIEVSSVDGFQGREKEAVIFSAVRSNDYGAIGFASDWRRVNVSFTRARRALIVIGNDVTLRRGDQETWSPWLAWADAHGLNMDRPGQSRGRYDADQLRRVRGGTTAAEMLKDVLERQQAQLKSAEQQHERAQRNAEGHIRASEGSDDNEDGTNTPKQLTLEEDLALMENTEGNWDDSDDDVDITLSHSASRATLASTTSSTDLKSGTRSSTPTDAWDL